MRHHGPSPIAADGRVALHPFETIDANDDAPSVTTKDVDHLLVEGNAPTKLAPFQQTATQARGLRGHAGQDGGLNPRQAGNQPKLLLRRRHSKVIGAILEGFSPRPIIPLSLPTSPQQPAPPGTQFRATSAPQPRRSRWADNPPLNIPNERLRRGADSVQFRL